MEEARKFYPINEKSAFRKKMLDALNDIRFSLCAWKVVSGPFIPRTEFKDIIIKTTNKYEAVKAAIDEIFESYFPVKNSNSLDEGQNENKGNLGRAKVLTSGHFNSSNNGDAA